MGDDGTPAIRRDAKPRHARDRTVDAQAGIAARLCSTSTSAPRRSPVAFAGGLRFTPRRSTPSPSFWKNAAGTGGGLSRRARASRSKWARRRFGGRGQATSTRTPGLSQSSKRFPNGPGRALRPATGRRSSMTPFDGENRRCRSRSLSTGTRILTSALRRRPLALPRTRWRLARTTRADEGRASAVRSFEDTPFYSRGLVAHTLFGEHVESMHESLSLDRFANPLVRLMLPFRMPRRVATRACCIWGVAPSLRERSDEAIQVPTARPRSLDRFVAHAPRNDAAGSTEMQDALISNPRTRRRTRAFLFAPAVHQASVARVVQPRALALETRLLRLRHRPELPEAEEEHRSKGEQHLDDAIIFLVHARSAFEAFRTLEPFEDAEHTDEGFAPAHDRVRGSPRNGVAAPRGFNEKVRASAAAASRSVSDSESDPRIAWAIRRSFRVADTRARCVKELKALCSISRPIS